MKRNEEGEFLAPIEMNFAGKRECYRILEEMEKRRKRRYEAVVYTRLDNYWFAPHPRFDAQEMKSLKLPYTMMIPDGSDWMGLNDRHAWMFREEAEAYFTKRTDNYTNAELAARGMWRVAECHLALAVGYPSERIGRFLPVAAIACLGRRNSSRCGIGPSQGSKWFKYFDEFTWAMAVARSQASWTAINLNVDTRSSIRTSISESILPLYRNRTCSSLPPLESNNAAAAAAPGMGWTRADSGAAVDWTSGRWKGIEMLPICFDPYDHFPEAYCCSFLGFAACFSGNWFYSRSRCCVNDVVVGKHLDSCTSMLRSGSGADLCSTTTDP